MCIMHKIINRVIVKVVVAASQDTVTQDIFPHSVNRDRALMSAT